MYGHLIPCRGGKTIRLREPRLHLGRRSADAAGRHLCELRFVDGCWFIAQLSDEYALRINDRPCRTARLHSGDTIAIGAVRYEIRYGSDSEQASVPAPAGKRKSGSHASVLAVMIPAGGGKPIPIRKERITVGRRKYCDVRLRLTTISSLHCGLERIDGFWQVVDLGSTNGVHVRGVRCEREWVYPRDLLAIGTAVFRFEYEHDGPLPPRVTTAGNGGLLERIGVAAHQIPLPEEVEDDDTTELRKRWELQD